MIATITSQTFQDHGVAHAPQTALSDPVEDLIDASEYTRLLSAPRFHLGHEGQGIALTSAIKCGKNLFSREYFHQFSGCKSSCPGRRPQGIRSKSTKALHYESAMPFARAPHIRHSTGFQDYRDAG